MSRASLLLIVLAACGGHPSPVQSTPPIDHEPERAKSYPIAVPTADPLPDIDTLYAKLLTDDYAVFVFDDGMVAWFGSAGVQAVGERHARLPDETLAALRQAFHDARFVSLQTPASGCAGPTVSLEVYDPKEGNAIDYQPCAPEPAIDTLLARFHALVGTDQFVHGNPDAPGGPLPDGEHLLVDYTRTACYGDCPVFQLLVFDDGTAVWNGEANVDRLGEVRAQLAPATIQALTDAFDRARFWELDDDGNLPEPCPEGEICPQGYTHCSDTSHTLLTYQRGADRHTTNDAHCGASALAALEDRVEDLVIGDEPWINAPVKIVELTGPDFTAALWSNRRLWWNGERADWVAAQVFYELEVALDEAKFFELDDKPIKTKKKCGPRYTISVAWDEQQRTITDDGCGDRPALRKLERALIDSLGIRTRIAAP